MRHRGGRRRRRWRRRVALGLPPVDGRDAGRGGRACQGRRGPAESWGQGGGGLGRRRNPAPREDPARPPATGPAQNMNGGAADEAPSKEGQDPRRVAPDDGPSEKRCPGVLACIPDNNQQPKAVPAACEQSAPRKDARSEQDKCNREPSGGRGRASGDRGSDDGPKRERSRPQRAGSREDARLPKERRSHRKRSHQDGSPRRRSASPEREREHEHEHEHERSRRSHSRDRHGRRERSRDRDRRGSSGRKRSRHRRSERSRSGSPSRHRSTWNRDWRVYSSPDIGQPRPPGLWRGAEDGVALAHPPCFSVSRLRPTRLTARGAVSTVAWSADTEVLLAGVQGGKRRATTAGAACSETCDSRNQDDWGPPSQAGLEGRRVPPGEENCGLLEECSSTFVVTQVLFATCELGVFDLLAEVPEALGLAAVAARLGVSSRGTELLLDACVSLKLLQVEVRREKAVYENTELASTYLARASPKPQQDMLLYASRTTYLGWGQLAAAVRDRRNQYLKAFGVPSEELFTAIYRCHSSVVMLAGMRRKAGHTCTLDTGKLPEQTQDWSYGIRGWGSVEGKTAAVSTNPRSGFRRPRSSLLTQYCLPIEEGRNARVALRIPGPVGGSGAVAKACMSLYPGSQITVFDIPDVVQTANRHFSFPEDERIGLCEGDFFKDCLPEPDLGILARVPHDWTDEKCSHLLVRTYQACKTDTWTAWSLGGRHPPVATATLDHLGQDRDACLPADGANDRVYGKSIEGKYDIEGRRQHQEKGEVWANPGPEEHTRFSVPEGRALQRRNLHPRPQDPRNISAPMLLHKGIIVPGVVPAPCKRLKMMVLDLKSLGLISGRRKEFKDRLPVRYARYSSTMLKKRPDGKCGGERAAQLRAAGELRTSKRRRKDTERAKRERAGHRKTYDKCVGGVPSLEKVGQLKTGSMDCIRTGDIPDIRNRELQALFCLTMFKIRATIHIKKVALINAKYPFSAYERCDVRKRRNMLCNIKQLSGGKDVMSTHKVTEVYSTRTATRNQESEVGTHLMTTAKNCYSEHPFSKTHQYFGVMATVVIRREESKCHKTMTAETRHEQGCPACHDHQLYLSGRAERHGWWAGLWFTLPTTCLCWTSARMKSVPNVWISGSLAAVMFDGEGNVTQDVEDHISLALRLLLRTLSLETIPDGPAGRSCVTVCNLSKYPLNYPDSQGLNSPISVTNHLAEKALFLESLAGWLKKTQKVHKPFQLEHLLRREGVQHWIHQNYTLIDYLLTVSPEPFITTTTTTTVTAATVVDYGYNDCSNQDWRNYYHNHEVYYYNRTIYCYKRSYHYNDYSNLHNCYDCCSYKYPSYNRHYNCYIYCHSYNNYYNYYDYKLLPGYCHNRNTYYYYNCYYHCRYNRDYCNSDYSNWRYYNCYYYYKHSNSDDDYWYIIAMATATAVTANGTTRTTTAATVTITTTTAIATATVTATTISITTPITTTTTTVARATKTTIITTTATIITTAPTTVIALSATTTVTTAVMSYYCCYKHYFNYYWCDNDNDCNNQWYYNYYYNYYIYYYNYNNYQYQCSYYYNRTTSNTTTTIFTSIATTTSVTTINTAITSIATTMTTMIAPTTITAPIVTTATTICYYNYCHSCQGVGVLKIPFTTQLCKLYVAERKVALLPSGSLTEAEIEH
ncbi:hypothetical protein EI555_002233, partial [Monodon monoceros]